MNNRGIQKVVLSLDRAVPYNKYNKNNKNNKQNNNKITNHNKSYKSNVRKMLSPQNLSPQ